MDTEALHQHFAQQSQLPSKLGVIDCVTFCAEGVKAGWGRDHLAKLAYWDRRTAVSRLRAAGGLHSAVTEALGPPQSISALEPGDLIYFAEPPTLGLLLEDAVAIKSHYAVALVHLDPIMVGWSTK